MSQPGTLLPEAIVATAPTLARPEPGTGLDAIFRPRSIAVIGASRQRGTVGGEIFHNLVSNGFQGPVYPVNPKADVIQSVRAYRSIGDVPDTVDLAVLVVPAAQVNDTLEACGRAGVKGAVIISAAIARRMAAASLMRRPAGR